jgi:hypothetical protein
MILTTAQRTNLHIAILALLEHGPSNDGLGICFNLNELYKQDAPWKAGWLDVYAFVSTHAVHWPERTGKLDSCGEISTYPIAKHRHEPLWMGEQYTLRMSLLRYLLAQVA